MAAALARGLEMTGAGLCDDCRHQRRVANTRGSGFSLCLRSRTDSAYARYPRLPVVRCPGFEPAQATALPREREAER